MQFVVHPSVSGLEKNKWRYLPLPSFSMWLGCRSLCGALQSKHHLQGVQASPVVPHSRTMAKALEMTETTPPVVATRGIVDAPCGKARPAKQCVFEAHTAMPTEGTGFSSHEAHS
mmetsp:Transcript_6879/g.11245  ORF Transcript_6879/g.11245 Transcript_6879/m.11245 type:complete len:115 (+) Transcript_6879:163-507(+)